MTATLNNLEQKRDQVLSELAHYVIHFSVESQEAYDTARLALADSLGCALLALKYPECTKLLGPVVPGTQVPHGCRIPGTDLVLDPIWGAFQMGMLIRWLDYNDTWLAAEWGHPSDNLGTILAVSDYLSRVRLSRGEAPLTVRDVLTAMIQAYEIQGGLALENSFNRIGFDHVILVKVASTAIATKLLGGTEEQVANALSQAWIDVGPLRTYRHAPNTGSRKSWAAGDACARGVHLALLTMKGEMGYQTPLTAKQWGFYDVLRQGNPFSFQRPLDSYVMENILFKISYPAEFHAQTAVEAAIRLHSQVKNRIDDICCVHIRTHESAVRIIDKKGPLHNPADRDHCLQYMVAIGLLHGTLTADHYESEVAADPRIDALREKMEVREDPTFTKDYLDPDKRSISNAVRVEFSDGQSTEELIVEYPVGHRKRREEGIPLLFEKFAQNAGSCFPPNRVDEWIQLFQNQEELDAMSVPCFIEKFVT